MLRYAIKSIGTRKVVTFLYILALIVTITLSMVSVNISSQINEGFFNADSKYDVVIGPEGSSTQLLMSSLFFSDEPLGTVSYKIVEDLQSRGDLVEVIPLGMADNYKGARVVGSSIDLLKDYELKSGKLFENKYEAVVGYNVAKTYGLKIGQELVTSHGLSHGLMSIGSDHQATYKLVGILDRTNTAYDNTVFTDIHTVWETHSHSDEEEHEEEIDSHIEEDGHMEEDSHAEQGHTVTAILVRTGSLIKANEITLKYNEDDMRTQAINPTRTMRNLMENIDLSKQVALLLGGIVILLSFIIIAIMTFLMLENISKDIKILRFLGMNRKSIFKYIMYQTALQVSIGVIVSIFLSRVVLNIANIISSQLGIVIAIDKVYSLEVLTILAVVVICLIPTIIYILRKRVGDITI